MNADIEPWGTGGCYDWDSRLGEGTREVNHMTWLGAVSTFMLVLLLHGKNIHVTMCWYIHLDD